MSQIELIAEVSTNHGGSVPLAKEFIQRFAEAGATFIKFQYTRVKHLRPDDPQFAWFAAAELQDDQFAELKAETERCGAKFLLTVYNHQDVPAVRKLCDVVKIGSGEAKQDDLQAAIQQAGFSRVIMSGLNGRPQWIELRCIARYPTPLRAAVRLARKPYDHQDGWSDHVIGVEACEEAIMAGAKIIEKHVQLPNQARPCKPFEATVSEFKHLRTFADEDPSRYLGRWQFDAK